MEEKGSCLDTRVTPEAMIHRGFLQADISTRPVASVQPLSMSVTCHQPALHHSRQPGSGLSDAPGSQMDSHDSSCMF